MRNTLLIIHLLAFADYVGSIFAHIMLGIVFTASDDMASYVNILTVKDMITKAMILPGQAILIVSGLGLIWLRGAKILRQGWFQAKIILVTLIVLNTLFILEPIGEKRVTMAQNALGAADLAEPFFSLGTQEDMFGAANLLMVLIIMLLSLRKRLFGRKKLGDAAKA